MLQNRQQKPISPEEMFQRLISQSYKQLQCEDQSQKIKKQKNILTQLIQQYETSIHSQIIKINQLSNLQKLKQQKLQQLQRLNRQRQIIEHSVNQELMNISITQKQHEEKLKLTSELQEVQCINNNIKLKLNDLYEYIRKLQIHNQTLSSQKDNVQIKIANRMRVNSEDWRVNIQSLRKKQQVEQNILKAKILEKQTENIKSVRRQQEQISRRNQQKWDEFRKTAFKPSIIPSYETGGLSKVRNFITRQIPQRDLGRFRVI